MTGFAGKVVIVTSAARGLGRVCALAFAGEGAKVVLSDTDEAGGAETLRRLKQAGGEGIFLPTDVRDEAQVEAMVAQTVAAYGRLDCAVNNAGTEVTGAIADQTVANYTTLMDANVKGVFLCMKHEIRQTRQNGGGAIVNQSSVTSDIAGTPRNGLYAATKAAVLGLTKTAALEVAKDNISINAIAAAAIDVPGDMIWQWIEKEGVPAEQIAASLPVGRRGRPEELVAAVLFLCSDTARFIVGQTLVLDGGFSVQ